MDADKPSSKVRINNGLVASFGARFTKFHWAALGKTSLARLSGVVPVIGAGLNGSQTAHSDRSAAGRNGPNGESQATPSSLLWAAIELRI